MPESDDVVASPKRAWLRWLIVLAFAAGIGGFYAFGLHEHFAFQRVRDNVGSFKNAVSEHFLLALLVFFAIYVVVTAMSLPVAVVLTLLAGALFDLYVGAAVVLLAATSGATLAFWSSRFLFHDWVKSRLGSRWEALRLGVERDGAFYLFSLRLVPLFPFFLINLGMGLTPIRTWTYFWVSLIGMAPGTLLYINVGRELASLEKAEDLVSPTFLISLALLGIAPLVFRKVLQWRKRV